MLAQQSRQRLASTIYQQSSSPSSSLCLFCRASIVSRRTIRSPRSQKRGLQTANKPPANDNSSKSSHQQQSAATLPKGPKDAAASMFVTPGKPLRPNNPISPIRLPDGSVQAKQLMRPIGVASPPQLGENSGIDHRSWIERNPQWTNLDKKLEARRELANEFGTSYFQDFKDLGSNHGKSFLSPPKLFKSTAALYFPNVVGRTLLTPDSISTTALFDCRVSIVTYASSQWALNDTKTFTDILDKNLENPIHDKYIKEPDDINDILADNRDKRKVLDGIWQYVALNVEENLFKSWLLQLSFGGIKKGLDEERWARYIHVRKGLTDQLKETMGIFNKRTGYVWLVDGECRIRWAGSGVATEDEKQGLLAGLQRLVAEEESRREEARSRKKEVKVDKVERVVKEEDEL